MTLQRWGTNRRRRGVPPNSLVTVFVRNLYSSDNCLWRRKDNEGDHNTLCEAFLPPPSSSSSLASDCIMRRLYNLGQKPTWGQTICVCRLISANALFLILLFLLLLLLLLLTCHCTILILTCPYTQSVNLLLCWPSHSEAFKRHAICKDWERIAVLLIAIRNCSRVKC